MSFCLPESFTGRWIWQSDKKGVTRNEKSKKNGRKNERKEKREANH